MSGSLLPVSQQFFDNAGNPLVNGKIFTYIAGTSTPQSTYTDYALTAANTNPVILDAAGRASIFGDGLYKVIVKDSGDVTLQTQDNVALQGTLNSIIGDFSVSGNATIAGNVTIAGNIVGSGGTVHSGTMDVIGSFTVESVGLPSSGVINLSDASGAAGGGAFAYNSSTGVYSLSGVNATLTINSKIVPRQLTAAPVNTAAAGQAGDYFVNSTFLYFYVAGTGWVRSAVATF